MGNTHSRDYIRVISLCKAPPHYELTAETNVKEGEMCYSRLQGLLQPTKHSCMCQPGLLSRQ